MYLLITERTKLRDEEMKKWTRRGKRDEERESGRGEGKGNEVRKRGTRRGKRDEDRKRVRTGHNRDVVGRVIVVPFSRPHYVSAHQAGVQSRCQARR